MLKNYITIALRSLIKKKGYSAINIVGLAVGMSACIMMLAFISHELSYDKFHSKSQNIYRLNYHFDNNGTPYSGAMMPFPIKTKLLNEYPEVDKVVRFYSNNALNNFPLLKYKDNEFTEDAFYYTDPEIFDVFDFNVIKGDPQSMLLKDESIVLTQSAALRYFGDEDPMGKAIRYQNRRDLTVTGIIEDTPENSHIQFDFLAPVNLQRHDWMGGAGNNGYDFEQDWNWAGAWCYILLKEHADKAHFKSKIQSIAREHFDDDGKTFTIGMQPLESIHLYSHISSEMGPNGNINQTYAFGIIAILILVIACINFMNLSTARAASRSREVGLRKVMGAHQHHLIFRFLGEAIFISLFAMILAGLLTEILLPKFNSMVGKELDINYFTDQVVILLMLGGAVLVGIGAGLYPAFMLSSFKPVQTLKNAVTKPASKFSLRHILVVGQFIVSAILIISIFVINRQLNFIKTKDLGFDKEHVLIIKNGTNLGNRFGALSNELTQLSSVKSTYRGYVPTKSAWRNSFNIEGREDVVSIGLRHVGFNFTEIFDLDIVTGRDLSPQYAIDSTESILLNVAAVEMLGWTKEEALGKTMSFTGGSDNQTVFNIRVVGVMENANFQSLHEKIKPLIFKYSSWGEVAIKLYPGNVHQSIEEVKKTWRKIITDQPLEYAFLDQSMNAQYAKEEKLGITIQYFTTLAIIIACMGLIGLVSFSTEQKIKEIGIRKVLGASVFQILALLTKNYLILIAVAFGLAIPAGYYLSDLWLMDFAYKIELTFDLFLSAGAIIIAIALITVSLQSLKAATANPADSLKEE